MARLIVWPSVQEKRNRFSKARPGAGR